MSQEEIEKKGKECSEEIAAILKKYDMELSVDIHMTQDYVNSLKPVLIPAKKEEIKAEKLNDN